jgi:secreted PhoX family phosphatase
MMPRVGLVGRLFSGARGSVARTFGLRNKLTRVSLALGAMAVMVGLSGCYWGYGSYYYYWGGGNGNNNALWVANGTSVVEFSPSQQVSGVSDPVPRRTISSAAFASPQGVVFDYYGDLWVIDGGTVASGGTVAPALYEFTAKQLSNLSSNAAPTPAMTISSASFVFPQQATFDGRGNLWVSDDGGNAVFVFTAAQLNTTTTTTIPAATITSTPGFNGPLGITFDYRGNLWVANNGSNTIVGFSASILPVVNPSSTAAQTVRALIPTSTLSDNGSGSIQAPWALAVDGYGNLWSSNANAPNTVVEFAKSQLAVTGSPTPNITLASATVSNNATLVAPNGLAFDNYGDLAVMSSGAPYGMAGYGPGQLRTNPASPLAPAVFLVGGSTTLNAPAGDTFGPTY